MTDLETMAMEVFIADNGRLTRAAAEKEWEAAGTDQRAYAYNIAEGLAPVIAAHLAEQAHSTITAYAEAADKKVAARLAELDRWDTPILREEQNRDGTHEFQRLIDDTRAALDGAA